MYRYNETDETRYQIKTGLTEYETATGYTAHRTRWDFAVYKNVIYMANGVDAYASYNSASDVAAYLTG
jgi:hypothetical protein